MELHEQPKPTTYPKAKGNQKSTHPHTHTMPTNGIPHVPVANKRRWGNLLWKLQLSPSANISKHLGHFIHMVCKGPAQCCAQGRNPRKPKDGPKVKGEICLEVCGRWVGSNSGCSSGSVGARLTKEYIVVLWRGADGGRCLGQSALYTHVPCSPTHSLTYITPAQGATHQDTYHTLKTHPHTN